MGPQISYVMMDIPYHFQRQKNNYNYKEKRTSKLDQRIKQFEDMAEIFL